MAAENAAEMDAAAKEASEELKRTMTLADVKAWWKRHYLKAGHKRLGRVLLEHKEN